jgi:hypothetical protein
MDIRVATSEGSRLLVGWAADEGWNPGLHDADAFLAADPEGFLIGWIGREPVAGISFVRYDSQWAFLGLYIVRPAHRHRGYGMAMWRAAMGRRESRSIGLDGVVARQADYARSGFALVRRHLRFGGRLDAAVSPTASRREGSLRSSGDIPFDALSRLDRTAFPADRRGFLRAWVSLPGHVTLASAGRVGGLSGYGVIRRCREGWRVGPLLAPDLKTAERLLLALAAEAAEGEFVFIDVPEPNVAGVRLAESLGMVPIFETARMVAGPVPPEPIERIFGITTLELG